MKNALLSSIFAISGLFAANANAVDLTIGSGGEGGTYYPLMSEMIQFCTAAHPNLSINHRVDAEGKSIGGSVNNIRGLLDNEIQLGLAQGDYAYLQSRVVPDMARIQALLAFHNEALHWIVPARVNVLVEEGSEGGLFGLGKKDPVYEAQPNPLQQVGQVRGLRVASWGGSLASVRVVDQLVGLGNTVIEADDRGQAMELLNTGQADVVMATVGYPAQWITELPDGVYSLLNVTDGTKGVVSNVYGNSGVSYDNMAGGGLVSTLTVSATLFTRTYRTDEMINALATIQSCVVDQLYNIQDTQGTHPAWQQIADTDALLDIRWDNIFQPPASFGRATPSTTTTTVQPAAE